MASSTTASSRLREARIAAGFREAKDACTHFGWEYPTYRGHENGNRTMKAAIAEQYAEAYGIEPGWLLYGTGTRKQMDPLAAQIVTLLDFLSDVNKQKLLAYAQGLTHI